MTMWTDRSGPSDESEGPALSPEERRAARQARRAAEARRLRMRRLSVTVTVAALVVVVGAVLVLRPAADVAPQTAGIASMATPAPAAPGYAADPVTSSQTQQPVVAEDAESDQPTSTDTAEPASLPAEELPVVSEGDYGSVVAAAQRALDVEPTGYFGPKTRKAVKEYQASIGLPATGQIATFTWSALGSETVATALDAAGTPDGYVDGEPADLQETPSPRKARSAASGEPPMLEETDSGEAVAVVQRALGVKPATGYFGPKTAEAVRSFQSDNGIPTTGVIATYTWAALGTTTASAAADAHAAYGTVFGPGAKKGNGNNGGGNGGNGNGGGGNGGGGYDESAASGSGANGMVCPVADFYYGDGLGAPRPGGRTHAGLDLMGSRGEPIYSITSGTVTRSGYQSNGSLILDITGSKGMFFYGHFDKILVGYGEKVSAGQLIGYMGDTGSPGAVHLHLEVRPYGWSGGYEDPVPLIKSLCG